MSNDNTDIVRIELQRVSLYAPGQASEFVQKGWSADLYLGHRCVDVAEAPTQLEALCQLFSAHPEHLQSLAAIEVATL